MPSDDIIRLYTFVSGTDALAAQVNGELDQLVATLNAKVGRGTVETISGNKTFSGTSLFSGSSTFSGAVTASNDLTVSGTFNIGRATDPGTLEDGDLWYNTATDALKTRINGATVELNPVPSIMGFRLSLASGTAVTTTDQTAKTTVYMTPYLGGKWLSLYDGTSWVVKQTAEISVAVPSNTNTPFDIFVYDNAGTITLEAVAWTNDTTRATALTLQDGIYVKSGATTRRYLGTGRTTAVSGQCEDSLNKRYLWNYYNRVQREAQGSFTANRTTTSTSFTEVNTEIRAFWVVGVAEEATYTAVNGTVFTPTGSTSCTGVSFDGSATENGFVTMMGNASGSSISLGCAVSSFKHDLAAGGHYATLVGASSTGATQTWHGATAPGGPTTKTNVTVSFRG